MKICYFGMYDPNYSRNRTLIKGLRQNGVEVVECNVRTHFLFGWRYPRLIWRFFQVKGWRANVIFIGFPGQTDVPLAWLFAKIFQKKLVFDVFYSLYNSYAFDRKYFSPRSWRAKFWYLIDWLSCFLADKVLLDTDAHIDYFIKTFHLPRNKFVRVFVGTDTDIFKPRRAKKHEGFVVGFHGSFLPLQGVPVILRAAKILEKQKGVRFQLLGGGNEYDKCWQLAKKLKLRNFVFLNKAPYEKLSDFIAGADAYLGGPFADSIKSNMVIPNKVYEAMACRKAVIVGDSRATRELFSDQVHCLFVKQGQPRDLAGTILKLKDNLSLREKIAQGGYNLTVKMLEPRAIAAKLIYELGY